ncbi:MAG: lipoyl(octanoyl) transferase LipB [Vibrionaceae bacterium]
MATPVIIRKLGRQPYLPMLRAMHAFTEQRNAQTVDELWLLEHAPVFTQGQAGKAQHLLDPGAIEVVQSDRGGQVTYHAPGQQIAYFLFDLRKNSLGVRDLVSKIELSLINTLSDFGIDSCARRDAPGVYVTGRKIASLGLRVRKGCSMHGLALNVNMDLSPFTRINPCGLAGMQMTQTADLNGPASLETLQPVLIAHICQQFDKIPDFVEHKQNAAFLTLV